MNVMAEMLSITEKISNNDKSKKILPMASTMAQQVKTSMAKLGSPSSIPGTDTVERENKLSQAVY